MPTVNGNVRSQRPGATFAGHSVLVSSLEPTSVVLPPEPPAPNGHECEITVPGTVPEAPDIVSGTVTPVQQQVVVSPDGRFTVELPPTIQQHVTFQLLAPLGNELRRVTYDVDALPPNVIFEADPVPLPSVVPPRDAPRPRQRLTGKVLDRPGNCVPSNRDVIIYGRRPDDQSAGAPVFSAKTDRNGYFAGEHPGIPLAEAYATVSGAHDPSGSPRIPIRLLDGGAEGLPARSVPRHVILVVTCDQPESHTDGKPEHCVCETPTPRAPDASDFVNSPESYSTDLVAGKCVDFTIPNRTLEEFMYFTVIRSSDPLIKGQSADRPRPVSDPVGDHLMRLASLESDDTPIDPRRPVARRFATARLDVAEVRRHLAAAPRVSTDVLRSVEIASSRNAFLHHLDLSLASSPNRTSITATTPIEWEILPLRSQATTLALGFILHMKQVWKADGYSLGDLLYSLPLAPCQKKQVAILEWTRRDDALRNEAVLSAESLTNLLQRDRDVLEVVNTTLREQMQGHSSAANVGYGQGGGAAAGGGGSVGLFDLGLGAVVGHAFGGGFASADAWQNGMRDLSAYALQQVRDLTMQAASVVRTQRTTVVQAVTQRETVRAETDVVTNHNHCHALTMEYFEVLRHFLVEHGLERVQECLFIPLPIRKFDRLRAREWRDLLSRGLLAADLRPGFDALDRLATPDESYPFERLADLDIIAVEGELLLTFRLLAPGASLPPKPPLPPLDDPASEKIYELAIRQYNEKVKEADEKTANFYSHDAPEIARKFVAQLKCSFVSDLVPNYDIGLDATLVSSYEAEKPLRVRLTTSPHVLPHRETVRAVRFELAKRPDKYTEESSVVVTSGQLRYRTDYGTYVLFSGEIGDDLDTGDNVEVATPLQAFELRSQRKEDERIATRLLEHLNRNIEYYHKLLWLTMDPDRRYILLDGFLAPNGKSLASVVENRVVGIVGNSLVMPVAPGMHLAPLFGIGDETIEALMVAPPGAVRISLPTSGVFAEAVMGSCNACEKKDESRFWRFEESPCGDQPTEIEAVSLASRRAPVDVIEAKDLPAPIINIQNPPSIPDPTGLGSALQLLGKSDLFRDITGLSETQKSALAALTNSLDAAKAFGQQAAQLAQTGMQKAGEADKAISNIKRAKDSGLLDDKQANELTMESLKGGRDKPVLEDPGIQKLVDSATKAHSSTVSVTKPGENVAVSKGEAAARPTSPPSAKPAGTTGLVLYFRTVYDQPAAVDYTWDVFEHTISKTYGPSSRATEEAGAHPGVGGDVLPTLSAGQLYVKAKYEDGVEYEGTYDYHDPGSVLAVHVRPDYRVKTVKVSSGEKRNTAFKAALGAEVGGEAEIKRLVEFYLKAHAEANLSYDKDWNETVAADEEYEIRIPKLSQRLEFAPPPGFPKDK